MSPVQTHFPLKGEVIFPQRGPCFPVMTFPKSSVSPAERPGGGSGKVSSLSPGIWWVSIWVEPDCGLGQLCTTGLGMQSAEHQAVTPDPLAGPVLPSDPVPLGWASRTFPEVFLALLQCLALAVSLRPGTLYLDGDLHESGPTSPTGCSLTLSPTPGVDQMPWCSGAHAGRCV